MSNRVKHSGIIDAIDADSVRVRILQTSACSSCKVAGYCNASESKEKIVDVCHVPDAEKLSVGDAVTVTASMRVATRALVLGFGVPFVILIVALIVMSCISADETIAALTAIMALIPYYIVLFLLRDRMRESMAFSIEVD